MKKLTALSLIGIIFALFATTAFARNAVFTWDWPSTNCDGSPLTLAGIKTGQLVIDTKHIPAADAGCVSANVPADTLPANATNYDLATNTNSITVDLAPGTYYARLRLQDVAGNWSQLTKELTVSIPVPTIDTGPTTLTFKLE